ncbi:hypothetical protein JWJ88_03455 [Paracoccus methylovorus]|uniref:Uncharacterized protein n=1 Tax=Paracoccus methylovorus TaxID=2812658 RepID=A0ABX7JHM0_9RHOB|nr:hypothetical protein [Paracoccus methylovorus]QRZ13733.1 hypothetical protein JWJ88_03455 [Paracoccus methylovorus]
MIAPEGYLCWSDILECVDIWAEEVERCQRVRIAEKKANDSLARMVLKTWLLANFMYEFEPILCGKDGSLLRVPRWMWFHADRLDACSIASPVDKRGEYNLYFTQHSKGLFSEKDVGNRFCALDPRTGLIRLRNNTRSLFIYAWMDEEDAEAATQLVNKMIGMSVCWNPKDLPSTDQDILRAIWGDSPFETGSPSVEHTEVRMRKVGRPALTPIILSAYDDLYPCGHHITGHSWEIVARRLSDKAGRSLKPDTIARTVNRRSPLDTEQSEQ